MNLIGYGFLSFFSKALKKIAIVIFIFGLFMSAGVVVLDRYICTKTNCISQSFEQLGRQGEYWFNEYLRVYADIDKYKYESYKKRFKYYDFTDENKFYQLNGQYKYKAEIRRNTRVDYIALLFFGFRKSDYTYSKLSLPDFDGESKKWLADPTLQLFIGEIVCLTNLVI